MLSAEFGGKRRKMEKWYYPIPVVKGAIEECKPMSQKSKIPKQQIFFHH
jgi:hypothetical protein